MPRIRSNPLEEAQPLALQLLDGLAAAHDRGIVHRDLKPANIKLTPSGELKILDFGLARFVSTDDSEIREDDRTVDQTQEGAVVGTTAYMSSEQATGMKVDARTDVFSAGCVLYELVTGGSPFHSESVPETLRRVLCEEPPSIGGRSNVCFEPAEAPAACYSILKLWSSTGTRTPLTVTPL